MTTPFTRNSKSPYISEVRPITRDDLARLRAPNAKVRLQRLKDSHHVLARLLASGMSNIEAAKAGGYTPQRVSDIKSAPAMVELIAKYRGMEDAAWKEQRDAFHEYIHAAGIKSWRKINDVLDDDEAEIPLRDLRAIADSSANRMGYGIKTTNLNVNVDFATRLEAAIARSNRGPKIIDVEPDLT